MWQEFNIGNFINKTLFILSFVLLSVVQLTKSYNQFMT